MGSDLGHHVGYHFLIFGIRRARDEDLVKVVSSSPEKKVNPSLYAKLRESSLYKIPKIEDRFIHVQNEEGIVYFTLLNQDGLEEAVYSHLQHTSDGKNVGKTVQQLVHLAHGFQQPESPLDVYKHPPLSTDYSEISGL